ncbi:phosphoenolpyruvate--protein phosphotransferase [Flexibacterium corallicola]|uniref:phosphoenolpyruvate--protein phosphotransferase n=1 Tax=Flexibacterium corallicola TaxID=3037259 RepID=UPI00286F6A44|nr:phosphoenolpyruvate--protein phosphotransferase [Pseudovibrio sp. M1P-2-3]
MSIITSQLITTGFVASKKSEVIDEAVALLVRAGKISPNYKKSMLGREKVANTFLGNGIAIPHGLPKDRELIFETAISVVQVPQGVDWGGGNTAKLVVAIAAKSDEHLSILSNLTEVVGDGEEANRLISTNDRSLIVSRLSGQATSKDQKEPQALEVFDDQVTVTLGEGHGLHARPASYIIDSIKGFDCHVHAAFNDRVVDAKSMISLLKLGAKEGSQVAFSASGPQSKEALKAILQAEQDRFGEEEEEDAPLTALAGDEPIEFEGQTIAGISSSPGYAIGPLAIFGRERLVFEATAKDVALETKELQTAHETALRQLESLYEEVRAKAGRAKATIFKAHQEFLQDPELVEEAIANISNGQSAPAAWEHAYTKRALALEGLEDPVLAGRAVDLRDVGRRVLRLLAKSIEMQNELPKEPSVLVADDLSPSDTAQLDPSLILGICTAQGGPTSHTSIIARSLDIPAVVGAGNGVLEIQPGTPILLDGTHGLLVTNPTQSDRDQAQRKMHDLAARRTQEKRDCYKPALTKDGIRIEVAGNISALEEAAKTVEAGGEGVGLLRTEFLFVGREEAPSEEEQFQTYAGMIQALNGLPIIIRTLDIGGDKEVPYLAMPKEENPFLGERGIRFCFAREDLFRTQLRAIFRAAKGGPVRIMFPMISTVLELEKAKRITEDIRLELGADPVEIGIMIEVPSAVLMAPELAELVDFFSIGTNDLTQYTLAMDRMHPVLASQADALEPSVLRMIAKTVEAADAAGIWTGACGGIAGDPLGATILSGLGLKELSMSIPSIASIKAQLRDQSMAENRRIAANALKCSSAAAVRALMK